MNDPYGQPELWNENQPYSQSQRGQRVTQYQQPKGYNQPLQALSGQFQCSSSNNIPLSKKSDLRKWYNSRTKKVKYSLGCGLIFALLMMISCIATATCIITAIGSSNLASLSTPIPPAQANHTVLSISPKVTPVPTVTHRPIVTPTKLPVAGQNNIQTKAYLGSDVSAFKALYGSHSDSNLKGSLIWQLTSTQWFDITFDTTNNHIYDLSHYFYPATQAANHQQDNVSFAVARNTCSRFMPPDSVLISVKKDKPDPDLTNGIQYIYKSDWLAHQLNASLFYIDEGGGTMLNLRNNPVDLGTYTLFYIGTEQTGFEMCYLTTGINWPY